MPVKLYNLSGLPDDPLRTLLGRAKRLAGCGGNVTVKVTRGGYRVTSSADQCDWVACFYLASRKYTQSSGHSKLKAGRVRTDGGCVELQPYHPPAWALRHPGWSSNLKDPIEWARKLFETAIHEFYHIREFQEGGKLFKPWSKRGPGGRRPIHGTRPEEIRAVNATDDALDKIRRNRAEIDDLLIGLAIQMEERWLNPALDAAKGKTS